MFDLRSYRGASFFYSSFLLFFCLPHKRKEAKEKVTAAPIWPLRTPCGSASSPASIRRLRLALLHYVQKKQGYPFTPRGRRETHVSSSRLLRLSLRLVFDLTSYLVISLYCVSSTAKLALLLPRGRSRLS